MVDQILCAIGGAIVVGVPVYFKMYLKNFKQRMNHDKLYDNLYKKFTFVTEERLNINTEYLQLKKEFQQLADEHNELKEKHAQFAALNPFETQAVKAVTQQDVFNEWLHGAEEESK